MGNCFIVVNASLRFHHLNGRKFSDTLKGFECQATRGKTSEGEQRRGELGRISFIMVTPRQVTGPCMTGRTGTGWQCCPAAVTVD